MSGRVNYTVTAHCEERIAHKDLISKIIIYEIRSVILSEVCQDAKVTVILIQTWKWHVVSLLHRHSAVLKTQHRGRTERENDECFDDDGDTYIHTYLLIYLLTYIVT